MLEIAVAFGSFFAVTGAWMLLPSTPRERTAPRLREPTRLRVTESTQAA